MANAITVEDLNSANALKTVEPKKDSIVDIGNGIINSAITDVNETTSSLNKLQNDQLTRVEKLGSLNLDLNGKAAFEAEQRKVFGLDTEKENYDKYNQELNDINATVKGLVNEAKAIPIKIQQDFKNTGATDAGVAPVQAGRLRENAIKALTASSLADVITANINNSVIRYNSALEKVNQAVDLKYEPIEKEIESLKEQLQINQEYIINPKEKRLAEKQNLILNERAKKIAEEKENEKSVNELFIQAAKNKAPQSVLNKIKTAKNIMEAAGFAGNYLTSPLEKLQMKKLEMDIAESKAKLSTLSTASAKEVKVDATKSLKSLVTELKTSAGMKGAVGFGWSKLIPGFLKGGSDKFISGTEAANYAATFNTLKDTLALSNIDKLKGAMSDKDLEFLRNTATKLSLAQSEKAFLTELNKVDGKLDEVLIKNGVDPLTINTYAGLDNEALINMASTNALNNTQFFGR